MSAITIKRGDTAIRFTGTLLVNGEPYDLSESGTVVKFLMRKKGQPSFSATAGIEGTGETGQVYFYLDEYLGSDFPTLTGIYRQEWEVTKAGDVLTFPQDSYNEVNMIEDLSP